MSKAATIDNTTGQPVTDQSEEGASGRTLGTQVKSAALGGQDSIRW